MLANWQVWKVFKSNLSVLQAVLATAITGSWIYIQKALQLVDGTVSFMPTLSDVCSHFTKSCCPNNVSKQSFVGWQAVSTGSRSVMTSQPELVDCLSGRSTSVLLSAQWRRVIWLSICPSACQDPKTHSHHCVDTKQKGGPSCVHLAPLGNTSFPFYTNNMTEEQPTRSVTPLLYLTGKKCQQSSSCNGRSLYNWCCCVPTADSTE